MHQLEFKVLYVSSSLVTAHPSCSVEALRFPMKIKGQKCQNTNLHLLKLTFNMCYPENFFWSVDSLRENGMIIRLYQGGFLQLSFRIHDS
jgi:hypothetical protein